MIRRVLSTLLAPTMIIAVGLAAFLWLRSQNAPPARTQRAPTPPLVETMVFEAAAADFEIRVGGNVVPRREVTISAQVGGTVVAKSEVLEGGRFVAKGVSLVQIDPANYKLDVESIGSELKQVDEDLRRLEVEASGNAALIRIAENKLTLAKLEVARLKSLIDSNAIAETEFEVARRFELDASEALQVLQNVRDQIPIRRGRLEAEKRFTEFRQRQAQLNLDRTNVVAPFDGIITNAAVELGDFVQTGDVLLEIEETAAVEVECNLPTQDLYWLWSLRLGRPAADDKESGSDRQSFEVPAVPATVTYTVGGRDFHWPGVLSRYAGRGIDRTTRTVPCRVVVSKLKREDAEDGPPALMRGMYVTVTLPVSLRERLLRIPSRAVQPSGQVWAVDENVLRIHEITPARVLPDGVLVHAEGSGLKAGDRIVVSQLATAFDGMHVREAQPAGPVP